MLLGEMLQDILLFGCVAATVVGARWLAGKLGWMPETYYIVRTMAEHARAVLTQKLGLVRDAESDGDGPLIRDGFRVSFDVDERSRSFCRVDWGSEASPAEPESDFEFGHPRYAGDAVLAWVDPQKPMEHLDWCLDLAHAACGSGLWGELEKTHGLARSQLPGQHPVLQGSVHGRAVSLSQSAEGLSLVASMPQGLEAVLGSGSTGNPVLDMLLDTTGVPPGAEEAVLALVHGHGARLQDGELSLLHAGPLADFWPAVNVLLQGLRP